MDGLEFLNFDDIEDDREKEELLQLISSQFKSPDVWFPWDSNAKNDVFQRANKSSLNVFAPSFQSSTARSFEKKYSSAENKENCDSNLNHVSVASNVMQHNDGAKSFQGNLNELSKKINRTDDDHEKTSQVQSYNEPLLSDQKEFQELTRGSVKDPVLGNDSFSPDKILLNVNSSIDATHLSDCNVSPAFKHGSVESSVAPHNCPAMQTTAAPMSERKVIEPYNESVKKKTASCESRLNDVNNSSPVPFEEPNLSSIISNGNWGDIKGEKCASVNDNDSAKIDMPLEDLPKKEESVPSKPRPARSFADVVKNKPENKNLKTIISKTDHTTLPVSLKSKPLMTGNIYRITEERKACIKDDKAAIQLGRHLHEVQIDLAPVCLQPRGLINRRNWCYINATLQALLACCPFYTLLRNLPIGIAVDREKSSTPVIDSMVSLAYEFERYSEPQQELQPGAPFQPVTVYETMGILKSDCLKGQQEDAEEFLSYILNGMHEEMVSIIKNYETEFHLNGESDVMKCNGNVDENDEEEWQVIGAKQRGMITRKVFGLKTPISDLLGGEIKSFLSTVGSKTASIQPFFTLQLDIQAENVTSVEEALSQMAAKEPIQGYTCTKTKQEVEAYSQVMLQKLPPILILHLKRFVYNINGGCKKVMKQTAYPLILELKKDLFSPEAKRTIRQSTYKLFAVVYHDGEEAVKGHYISDIYNHGSKCWIRCDDRSVSSITEPQVLSHSPPRVPYLLFYQICNDTNGNSI